MKLQKLLWVGTFLLLASPIWAQVPIGGGGGGVATAVTVTSGTITCTNCSGSGASNTEDNPHVTADPLAPTGAVRKATPVNLSNADGDYEPLQMSAGRLWVSATIDAALPAGNNNIGDVDIASSVLPTGAATAANQATEQGYVDGLEALIGTSNTSLAIIDNIVFGPGTAAAAQRVTFASDAPAITVTDGVGVLNTIIDSGTITSITNAVSVTNAGTFAVQATGTLTTNAAAPGATNVGALVALANAAAPSLTEGRQTLLSTDLSGALRVVGSSGTTQYNEDVAHVDGNATVFISGIRRDTTPSSSTITAGDYAAFNLDANGRLYVNSVAYDAAGAAVSFASDKLEDVAHVSGDAGPAVLTRRIDTLASSAGTTGAYATFNSNASGALWVAPSAATNGGADSFKRTSVGTTEDEHEVKATAGNLYSITATNTNAAVRYLRCANNTAAGTTPGTTTPIVDLAIPGAATGAGITFAFPVGVSFSTGLTCWLVTGAADTDVAEVAANELKILYSFR